jgi:hypothetical protein
MFANSFLKMEYIMKRFSIAALMLLTLVIICNNNNLAQEKEKKQTPPFNIQDNKLLTPQCSPGVCIYKNDILGCLFTQGWNSNVVCYSTGYLHENDGPGWVCLEGGIANELQIINDIKNGNWCSYHKGCGQTTDPIDFGSVGCKNPPSNMAAWFPLDEFETDFGESREISNLNSYNSLFWHDVTPVCEGFVFYALKFNGTSSYIYGPSFNEINFGPYQNFSIAVWINFSGINGIVNTILDKRACLSDCGKKGYYLAYDRSKSKFVLQLATGVLTDIDEGFTNYSSNAITIANLINKWHLLVVTVRRGGPLTGRKVRFYIDGQSFGEAYCSRTGDLTNDASLLVGKRFDNRAFFNGTMDELQLYRGQLTVTEINKIFSAKHYGLCKDPAYKPCEFKK